MNDSIHTLFPLYYYHASLDPESVDLLGECIDFDAETVDASKEGSWFRSVDTSFPSFIPETDHVNHSGNTITDIGKFNRLILFHMNRFINQIYSKEDPSGNGEVEVQLVDGWINKYNKGQGQEVHSHEDAGANFSGCIFLKYDPDKDSKFVFVNTDKAYKASGYWPLFHPRDRFYLEAKENDIILFPSLMTHCVEEQKHDTDRTTLSFNFGARPYTGK